MRTQAGMVGMEWKGTLAEKETMVGQDSGSRDQFDKDHVGKRANPTCDRPINRKER